jgi:hypothetical protein
MCTADLEEPTRAAVAVAGTAAAAVVVIEAVRLQSLHVDFLKFRIQFFPQARPQHDWPPGHFFVDLRLKLSQLKNPVDKKYSRTLN